VKHIFPVKTGTKVCISFDISIFHLMDKFEKFAERIILSNKKMYLCKN